MVTTPLQIQIYTLSYSNPNYLTTISYIILIYYICRMTAKEYLLTEHPINLAAFAKLMYGDTSSARPRLSNKIHGHLTWTANDEANAIRVLNDLKIRISEVVK